MKNASTRFVMMHGVAGAGKSSLAQNLAAILIDQGAKIDQIPEETVFTRNEFVEVGQRFKTRAWPTADVMLAAYSRVIQAACLQNRWVIADWNCVGMIEDLPWAQPDSTTLTTFQLEARADVHVLTAHAQDVRVLAAELSPILLVLTVPSRVAVRRAAAERGQEWIERYAAPVQELEPGEPRIDRIVRGYESGMLRHSDIINAYIRAGWNVAEIDANCARKDVLHQAIHHLLSEESAMDRSLPDHR